LPSHQGDKRKLLPHISVPDIRWLNWKAVRAAGFKGVVFDKDNTLTFPYAPKIHPPLRDALTECRDAFADRIVLYSNSAGLLQFDPQGTEAKAVEEALGIPVLRHREKKPGGGAEELEQHFGCSADELVMVGDRFLTDVAFGAKHGMLTVRCEPLSLRGEPPTVLLARKLEEVLVGSLGKGERLNPPEHRLTALAHVRPSVFVKDPAIW